MTSGNEREHVATAGLRRITQPATAIYLHHMLLYCPPSTAQSFVNFSYATVQVTLCDTILPRSPQCRPYTLLAGWHQLPCQPPLPLHLPPAGLLPPGCAELPTGCEVGQCSDNMMEQQQGGARCHIPCTESSKRDCPAIVAAQVTLQKRIRGLPICLIAATTYQIGNGEGAAGWLMECASKPINPTAAGPEALQWHLAK